MLRRRATHLLCTVITALSLKACASGGPPPKPAPAASADEVSLQIFSALERDDLPAATRDFSGKMSAALTTFDLRQIWRQLIDAYGPLKGSSVLRRFSRDGLEVREVALRFERGAMVGRVAVKPDNGRIEGLFFRPADPSDQQAAAQQPPDATAVSGVRSEEVVVGKDPWKLPGTITLPESPGPFPAVVLVHGSGPQNRDEAIGPNKPFRDIAEDLARAGIASLRYDKRTLIYRQQLDATKVTVEEEVIADAVAALGVLRGRSDIRADGLFIVGHSLGAQLAPIIGERDGKIAGLILLAAPSRPMPQAIIEQARVIGKFTPAQLKEMEDQAERIIAGKALPTETFLGVPTNYFRDLLSRDCTGAARRLGRPVLLLRGERDYQVLAEEQVGWQKALAGLQLQAHTLPRLNHQFIAGEGPPGPQDYRRAGRVDGSVTGLISRFIRDALGRKPVGAT